MTFPYICDMHTLILLVSTTLQPSEEPTPVYTPFLQLTSPFTLCGEFAQIYDISIMTESCRAALLL